MALYGREATAMKTSLRYRKAGVKAPRCRDCNHYVSHFRIFCAGRGGDSWFSRCTVLGLLQGARYTVHPDYTCDRVDTTISRMIDMGEGWYRTNYGIEGLMAALEARDEREELLRKLKEEGKIR